MKYLRLLVWSFTFATVSASAQERTFNLATATIADMQAAMEAGALTSERLVELYLARIEAYDQKGPALNAIITISDTALEQARALDEERRVSGPRSPLHGIPLVFKDTIDTLDAPTSGGALAFEGLYPLDDSTVVRKLKEAGAVVLAKTNLDEFNRGSQGLSSLGGQVLNPYDLTRNPGGSSAGTGVAVNAWFAAAGLGTETGASVRSPASNNSLVGIVPTQGLVGRGGILPISYTQDRAGPHGRTVADAATLLTYMRGLDAEDLFTHAALGKIPEESYTAFLDAAALDGARLGVLEDLFRKGEEYEEIADLIRAEIDFIEDQGALVMRDLSTGMDLVSFIPKARASGMEFYDSFHAYLRQRGPDFPYPTLESLIESGEYLENLDRGYRRSVKLGSVERNPQYLARLETRETLREVFIDLMDEFAVDALIHPFKCLPAPPLGTGDRGPRDNPFSSVTGLPAIVVPAGVTSEGLPISIEILGRPFSEPTLIALAYAYEQASQKRVAPTIVPPLPGESFTY